MANPLIVPDQLREAEEQLSRPIGPVGLHCSVKVSSLERQDTRIVNNVVQEVKTETLEFEIEEVVIDDSMPTRMWKFEGDLHVGDYADPDNDKLRLLLQVHTKAKLLETHERSADSVRVTGYFRPRSNETR